MFQPTLEETMVVQDFEEWEQSQDSFYFKNYDSSILFIRSVDSDLSLLTLKNCIQEMRDDVHLVLIGNESLEVISKLIVGSSRCFSYSVISKALKFVCSCSEL